MTNDVPSHDAPDSSGTHTLLRLSGYPLAITATMLASMSPPTSDERAEISRAFIVSPRSRNTREKWFFLAGYSPLKNPHSVTGLWKLEGRLQTIYARNDMTPERKLWAADTLSQWSKTPAAKPRISPTTPVVIEVRRDLQPELLDMLQAMTIDFAARYGNDALRIV